MIKNILVLAPHTDDGELGCGGAIARFCEEKRNVFYAAFSAAEESVPKGFPKNALRSEVKKATELLGIPESNLILYDFKVRRLAASRQEILENLIMLRNEIKPDMVIVPSINDIHQDHSVVAAESIRAFKNISILGYEEPWNNITFNTTNFIILDKRHVEKKIEALNCYKTQASRSYLNEDYIFSLARIRGVQINSAYAEAFEVIRWIIQ